MTQQNLNSQGGSAPREVGKLELTPERLFELRRTGMWQELYDSACGDIGRLRLREGSALDHRTLAYRYYAAAEASMHLGNREDALSLLRCSSETLSSATPTITDRFLETECARLERALSPGEDWIPKDLSWQPGSASDPRVEHFASEFVSICRETGADSALVAERGRIINEWYGSAHISPMAMMSSTKSIAAIIAFMLRDDSGGAFALDTPVHQILTDWEDWQSQPKSLVTVRHLLTQTAGIPGNRYCGTAQCPQWGSVGNNHNERARTLDLPEELLPPGTKFDYSNAGTQLLDPVLSRIAKRDLASFCQERIFTPLGMKETNLRRFDDQSGGTFVYADMESTPRDMAKLALALLEGRLLSQESRDEMFSTPQEKISGANPGYGHLFWKDLECRVISMQGYLGNDVYMIPEHDLILVRTQAAPPQDNTFYSRSSEAFLRFVGVGG